MLAGRERDFGSFHYEAGCQLIKRVKRLPAHFPPAINPLPAVPKEMLRSEGYSLSVHRKYPILFSSAHICPSEVIEDLMRKPSPEPCRLLRVPSSLLRDLKRLLEKLLHATPKGHMKGTQLRAHLKSYGSLLGNPPQIFVADNPEIRCGTLERRCGDPRKRCEDPRKHAAGAPQYI